MPYYTSTPARIEKYSAFAYSQEFERHQAVEGAGLDDSDDVVLQVPVTTK